MPSQTTPNDRLDSWKGIAEYLKRNQRTAIRWEKEKGLPVHRVPGGYRQAVFAYRQELDNWLKSSPEISVGNVENVESLSEQEEPLAIPHEASTIRHR